MNYDKQFKLEDPRDDAMQMQIVPEADGESAHMFLPSDGYLHLLVEELVELRDWLNEFIEGDAA